MKKLKTLLALGGLAAVIGCNTPEQEAWNNDFRNGTIKIPNECYRLISLSSDFGMLNLACTDNTGQPFYFERKREWKDWKKYKIVSDE